MYKCIAKSCGVELQFLATSLHTHDVWVGILGCYWEDPFFWVNPKAALYRWVNGDLDIRAKKFGTSEDFQKVSPELIDRLKVYPPK